MINHNRLPLVSGEWIIVALRSRLDEIKEEAEALQTVTEQHRLPENVQKVCQEMLLGIDHLNNNLSQLETSLDAYRCSRQTQLN
jgi:uncharacterized protein (UPF0147 family)